MSTFYSLFNGMSVSVNCDSADYAGRHTGERSVATAPSGGASVEKRGNGNRYKERVSYRSIEYMIMRMFLCSKHMSWISPTFFVSTIEL